MKKDGYLLFCRKVEFEANSNESHVEQVNYTDKILGFFDNEEFAADTALRIIKTEFDNLDATEFRVRRFFITADMLKGYTLDENGHLGDEPEFHPYMRLKTKPVNGKKKIYERTMYIVDCNHYIDCAYYNEES